MRKTLTLLSLLVLIITVTAAFRDIPKGHWAQTYVERLEQIGIITGFPDGTYRGDEALTRYQTALFISRTLDYLEQLLAEKQQQLDELKKILQDANQQLDEKIAEVQTQVEDIKLTVELHDQDIIKLYDLVNQLNDKFVYTYEDGSVQEISLVELKNDIVSLSDILNGLAAQLGDVDYLLRKQIGDLDKKTTSKADELSNALTNLSAKVDELNTQFEMLQSKLDDVNDKIANLYDTLSEAIIGLQENLTSLEASLTSKIDDLETRVLNIESTLNTGLPAIRDMLYGLSQDLANAQESMKAYTDVVAESLQASIDEYNAKCDEHMQASKEKFDDVYQAMASLQDMLSSAIVGQQEELANLSEKLDKLNDFVVNFTSETSDKISVIGDRLSLLENQVASLSQVVDDVKADKSEVEELKSNSAKEIENARNIATWGAVFGVSGTLIGIIALAKALGWF
ncbi:MAG: S-layer homology domain-containing protein [Fervidobacterium sp.]